MNKSMQLIAAAVLSLAVTACGSSKGSDKTGGTNANLTTYSESEHSADITNLNSTEKGLEGVGLKFKTNFSYENGVSTTTYSWDSSFLQSFQTSHPTADPAEIIPALQNYVNVANAYLNKYSGTFNIKKSDGSVATMQIIESVRHEIEAKVSVSNKSIAKLKEL